MDRSILVLGIAAILLVLTTFGLFNLEEDNRIKIGVLLPLTGDFASFGQGAKEGIESVDSEGIEFIFEDSRCDPLEAVNAFKKLTEIDRVNYIMGPGCGSPQEAIAPLAVNRDVVILLPVAASQDLFDVSNGKVFQMQYSLEDESKFIAEYFNSLNIEKVALISYQNAYSQTHSDSFKKHFSGEIEQITYTELSSDLYSGLVRVKSKNPEIIFSSDLSFFLMGGLKRLEEISFKGDVYSLYPTEYPPVRELVEGVTYSYPGDILGDRGSQYYLARESTELLVDLLEECSGEFECVSSSLKDSEKFDEKGISKRSIVFRKIEKGTVVAL